MNTKPTNLIELMEVIAESLFDERDYDEVQDDLIQVELHVEQWIMSREELDVCLKLIRGAIDVQYQYAR